MIAYTFESYISDGVITSHRGAVAEGEQDFSIPAWLAAVLALNDDAAVLSLPPGEGSTSEQVASYRTSVKAALARSRLLLDSSERIHPPEHISPRDPDSESNIQADFFKIRISLTRVAARLVDLVELSGYLNGARTIIQHTTRQGDTLQHLAILYYNDVNMWTIIADYNSISPGDESVGSVLLIPVKA